MKQPNITIVDYGVGNTQSVFNAIDTLGYRKLKISSKVEDILDADALILPGVGAFEACANRLREGRLNNFLNEAVLVRHTPILGICVGMQLMSTISEENGVHAGLDWIPGQVVKLELPEDFAVPHVGWNNIHQCGEDILFSRIYGSPNFYFDHSYHYQCDPDFVTAVCDYGISVTAIRKDHIHGVQFHPEKSQNNGLKIFRSFFNAIR